MAEIQTDGGVSLFTGEPYVTMRVDDPALTWQWTPKEARSFAVLLIRTAAAAEDDAALRNAVLKYGLGDEVAANLVHALRTARDEVWG